VAVGTSERKCEVVEEQPTRTEATSKIIEARFIAYQVILPVCISCDLARYTNNPGGGCEGWALMEGIFALSVGGVKGFSERLKAKG
jgi:hypothetical protein